MPADCPDCGWSSDHHPDCPAYEGPESDEAWDEDDGADDRDCYWCGGDGWVECDDPIQCTRQHRVYDADRWPGQECRCSSCGGSGRAEDMTIW